ncbi:MAG TPA: ABC transporter ATP-binding protein, partial [Thermoanaerobaculia bacterium]|nr:ABC transporter ATP-binding protein [Thermoanaerobaculia bacterium]
MSSEVVVRLEEVALCYRLAKQRHSSIKDFAIHWMKGALTYEQFWALQGIDLTVRAGERLGIIGRNGAGKSSLLKVVSGVLKPTRGTVETRGQMAPILELGTGFDHELTGLENVYLNALLLGHSRREIEERVAGIVEFSELGDFIRSPIRTYSSGMLARLGFSIATAWVPDVLILDEVLAVGDAHFIVKSRQRLAELRDSGTALLLVSHDLKAVRETCDRCLWIDGGRIAAEGEVGPVVELYENALEVQEGGPAAAERITAPAA